MNSYVALLRGIMPMNPNMRGEKLRGVFESLGFTDVHSIIGSGNIIFGSKSKNAKALEASIEKALTAQLGFTSTTIIRSKEELKELVRMDPFKGKTHGRSSYLLVTFFKDKEAVKNGMVPTVIDLRSNEAQKMMATLEKKYGKGITSRTWKTIERILEKFEKTKK